MYKSPCRLGLGPTRVLSQASLLGQGPTYLKKYFYINWDTQKSTYYFWLFLLVHTILWTVGPSLFRPTIPHDTLEGITWGFQWQLGYNKHPFLAAWLSAGVTQLFGVTGWPVYLLAQLAVTTTFIAVLKLSEAILPKPHAIIATLLLEGVFFYNINSFNFTPDTLQSPLWALLSLWFYKAITKQQMSAWCFTAIFAALGVCTKYQTALLLLPMFLFCLINSEARQSFRKPGLYCALLIFFICMMPHLIWLYQHHFITISYAFEISSDYTPQKSFLNYIKHPTGFLLNAFLDIVGVFILLWPFYKTSRGTVSPFKISTFQTEFCIFLGLGPVIITLILCCISGNYFPPRWSTPYFFMIGILCISYLKPTLSKRQLQQFFVSLIIFSTLLFIGRMSTFIWFPRSGSDAFLPNKHIASTVSKIWEQQYHTPLPYLAGSHYLVTGLVPYITPEPIPYLSWDFKDSSWVDENQLRKRGGVFIWDKNKRYTWDLQSQLYTSLPDLVAQRFPSLKIMPDSIFYTLSDNQPIVIGIALLPPE